MKSGQSSIDISLFNLLREEFGNTLQPLQCTKATLVHLSHTLEDLVLTRRLPALLFTGFQESSHWREETERYRALADIAQQVCIFAGGTLPAESSASELHVTLRGDDPLRQEWFLALLCPQFAVLLCGQDRNVPSAEEATRQFDTLWSFDPHIIDRVLDLLEQVVANYRPERLESLQAARKLYPLGAPDPQVMTLFTSEMIRFEEQLHQTLVRTTTALNEQIRWREDLTATLVHDMRTPLQGLLTSIELLERYNDFDQTMLLEMLGIAKRSTVNLRQMVQLILDTNQLSAGSFQMSWVPIVPKKLIESAVEPLLPLINAQQQVLEVLVGDRVSFMWGDSDLLSRVIQNLVGNAHKFTPAGGNIIIGIDLTPSGESLELRVRDSGKGIAPAAIPNIFDRYYQASAGDRQGSGLGLYFCRLASEAHGGTIRAASQIGNGTTITLVLPLRPPRS
ncbi:MAG: hypothetical protein H7Z42_21975 [Roseiflexaceae bacterium]|nr:hypothetical protein [Roseiflexaceae bacterium]